jgi:hypothetical protein
MKTAGAATADTLISRHPLVAQIAGGGDEALRFASGSVEFQLSATMPLSPADNADLTCGNQVVHLTSAARIIRMFLRPVNKLLLEIRALSNTQLRWMAVERDRTKWRTSIDDLH